MDAGQKAADGERESAYRAALDTAVRSLGQREHGRRELERKLRSKGHAPVLVEQVMDYLSQHDLQSDDRFAESFVRSRIQKGYGPVRIRQELATRGVSEEAQERQLTEPAEFWLDVARRVLDRKFGRQTLTRSAAAEVEQDEDSETDGDDRYRDSRDRDRDRNRWNAHARFLARRGFPADLIYRALGPDRS